MERPIREILTIFSGGEEVSGLLFYGLRQRGRPTSAIFPSKAWPPNTRVSDFMLYGNNWEVLMWEVEVSEWPRSGQWTNALQETFSTLLQDGAVVSWIGIEGYFCDPPDLFRPECMSRGVLAAMTADGSMIGQIHPDQPLARLSDADLEYLRSAAKGLADTE